jgi:hypothetical protein
MVETKIIERTELVPQPAKRVTRKKIVLELDENEAEAITYFAQKGASHLVDGGLSGYRTYETLPYGSLAASIVRVVDALEEPLAEIRNDGRYA